MHSSFVTSLSSVCVAVVAGPPPSSSSVAEDITDDVTLTSNQSSKSRSEAKKQGNATDLVHSCSFFKIGVIKKIISDVRGVDFTLCSVTKTLLVLLHLCDSGNTFYLVMPIEQGESMTEDLNDPPTPTASHFPPPVEEMTLPQTQMEEEPAARGPEANQSETMQLEQEKETGHLQAAQHTHVIRNVDEIFHTIEELMTKLRHLKVSFVEKMVTKEQPVILSVPTANSTPLPMFSVWLLDHSNSGRLDSCGNILLPLLLRNKNLKRGENVHNHQQLIFSLSS